MSTGNENNKKGELVISGSTPRNSDRQEQNYTQIMKILCENLRIIKILAAAENILVKKGLKGIPQRKKEKFDGDANVKKRGYWNNLK